MYLNTHAGVRGVDPKLLEAARVFGLSSRQVALRILAGLDRADAGRVRVAGARSVVFEESRLVPVKRVWENVVIDHDRLSVARRPALAALDE